jgi:uncharacterized membrane protein
MEKIIQQGRLLYGLAITGYGVENLVCAHCVHTDIPGAGPHSPVIPWVSAHPWFAYLTGIVLLAAGLSIMANRKARLAAFLLGVLFLVFVVFLEAPRLIREPLQVRTITFETLAMCGAAFVLTTILPREGSASWPSDGFLDKLGRYLVAFSLLVFGADHFLFLDFVAGLVPSWIPWHLFWAAFTGAAFVASGISIASKWLGRWERF